MTDRGCRGPRALLMEYALDDLDPLKRQRVESHVERCDACAALLARYQTSFASAKTWDPEVPPDDLERMVGRLTPYIESQRPRRASWMVGFGSFALAAAAAAVFFVGRTTAPEVVVPIPVAAVSPTKIAAPIEVERSQPTEHLRVVASSDWNGRVKRTDGKHTQVEMSEGFAVMSFEGGRGRSLQIAAPDLTIEVVGTRFFVEARPEAPTVVGVVTGKVRVRTANGEELIEAGAARAFDDAGSRPVPSVESVRSAEHHADAFLEYEAPPEPPPVKKKRVVAAPPPPPAVKRDVLADMAKAEQLAREGRHAQAVGVYTEALAYATNEPLRRVVRFERARLWAFHLDRVEDAKSELRGLAAQDGEVAVQAALTLCELDRTSDPCRTRQCLEALSERGVREAEKTAQRWALDRFDCGS